jgi:site-specific recombinase XerD
LISEIVEHATGQPLHNYAAEEWLREWLQGKKTAKAEGTFLKYDNAINTFLTSLGSRAKFNVNQIAPRDVLRFRDAEIAEGKSPGTANDHIKIVRMAFTTARKQGYITHNPAEAAECCRKIPSPPSNRLMLTK